MHPVLDGIRRERSKSRPENFSWKWDVAKKNQDGAWLGNVNAGLQFSLRDEKYSRPLNTNFYLQKPLILRVHGEIIIKAELILQKTNPE